MSVLGGARKFYTYLGLLAFGDADSAVSYRRAIGEAEKLKVQVSWYKNALRNEKVQVDVNAIRREVWEKADRQYQFSQAFLEKSQIYQKAKEFEGRVLELESVLVQREERIAGYGVQVSQLLQQARTLKLDFLKSDGLNEQLKAENKNLRNRVRGLERDLTQRVASSRKVAHGNLKGVLSRYYLPQGSEEIVFLLDHFGAITYQSPRAEDLFRNLRGKKYQEIVGGSGEQVDFVGKHFNPSDNSEHEGGWVYVRLRSKKGKEKLRAAKAEIVHEYISERVDGKEVNLRHSTIVKLSNIGWKSILPRILSGEKCLQDIPGDLARREEIRRKNEEIVEEARRGVEEIIRRRGTTPS